MPAKTDLAQLEERQFELDAEIRRREIAVKEAEVKRGGLTAAQATVAGAALALISGVVGASIAAWSSQNIESGKSLTSLQIEQLKVTGNHQLEESKQRATEALERKKFETSLILEAIRTPSRSDAIRNLKFFVAAGFVTDPDGKIVALSDENLPSISGPSEKSINRVLDATGKVILKYEDGTISQCTGMLVSPTHVVTASFCIQEAKSGTTAEDISFKIGERVVLARPLWSSDESNLALLRIPSGLGLDVFLERSPVREPALGERVFFALWNPNLDAIELRTCNIVRNAAADSDFRHDCPTGAGSAGAIVIAVADDALLGVHYSADGQGLGTAAKISGLLERVLKDRSSSASTPTRSE